MVGCSAFGCSKSSRSGNILYRFPRNESRRRQWELKVRRKGWCATDYSRLCQDHFEPQMFFERHGKRKLKEDAVPTLFAHSPAPRNSRKQYASRIDEVHGVASSLEHIEHDHAYHSSHLPQPSEETKAPVESTEDRTAIDSMSLIEQEQVLSKVQTSEEDDEKQALKKQIKALFNQNATLQEENRALLRKLEEHKSSATRFLNPDQVRFAASQSRKVKKWTEKTIRNALQLRSSCGSTGYNTLLAQSYPLPSLRTLRRLTELKK